MNDAGTKKKLDNKMSDNLLFKIGIEMGINTDIPIYI